MKKFTLIELLVVVAIIGILASMIFPSLSSAREQSKRAICKNNVRQVAIGGNSFADDNDNLLPSSTDWATTISDTGGGYRQMGHFFPYIDTLNVFYCPNMPNKSLGGTNFSYEYNKNRFKGNSWCQAGYSYRKMSDPNAYSLSRLSSSDPIIADPYNELYSARFGLETHQAQGYNVAYADTSVVWVRDPSQYCVTTNWSNVAISRNDTAVWTVLFDRD